MIDDDAVFNSDGWRQALEQFSAVTSLSVTVYAQGPRRVGGAPASTPLYDVYFGQGGEHARLDAHAARVSGAPADAPRVVVYDQDGLAALTVQIRRGTEVLVAVAGLALTAHLDEERVGELARAHGLPFEAVWTVVRDTTPVSHQRLTLCGELLATVAETLLRENERTRQLEATSAQLAETMRMKDEFLAIVSHELRTPLTPILSWTQIVKRRPHTSNVPEVMDVIERNVRRQIELVNELLDLNRLQRGKLTVQLQPRDLREIVRAAVQTVEALGAHRNLTIVRHEPEPPVVVNADAPRLTQVFGNLLSNAIKFTPAGGRIEVDVEVEGEAAIVTVRDTGAGIAPGFLPFVFDMFRQEDGERRQHGGLGIGLALARRLTELHRGTIRARSDGPGKGTEMIVTLPVFQGAMRSPVPESHNGLKSLPRFDDLSVLVVEDTDDTRTAACVMLEELGAKVTRAGDGLDALRQLDEGPAPDVVLCDLRMPAMDGFEFLRRLRDTAYGAALPVIACSGLVATDDERKRQEAGFAGYLRKPFDYEALADVLGGVARQAVADARRPPGADARPAMKETPR